MTAKKDKVKTPAGIFLALIFLANPNIHIIDILPDFISYIIIVRALSYASDRAPYFAEARSDFKKLLVVSLIKIPVLVLQTYVRQGNVADNDILALTSFSFAVIEIVFLICAIKNLFSAFYYLGERSEAGAILSSNPEGLRALCIIFSILKCAAYSLPELLLLTRGVNSGNAHTVFNFARLYPYTVVILVPLVFTLGIITAVKFKRYLQKIYKGNAFVLALDSLINDSAREELNKKERIRTMKSALTLISVSSIFTLELRFDNFGGINLLPRFIFGALLIWGFYRLSKHVGKGPLVILPSAVYTLVALLHFVFETSFISEFSYGSLSQSPSAKGAYLLTMIFSAIELIALITLLVFCAALLVKFTKMHTGIEKGNEKYSRIDCEYHRKMKTRVCIWAIIGALGGVARLLDGLFKYFPSKIKVTVGSLGTAPEADEIFETDLLFPTTSFVTGSAVPWFGIVLFLVTVAFIAYSFYLFSIIKDEVELKYL